MRRRPVPCVARGRIRRRFLLARPYLPRSVYIEVTDRAQGRPYWLVGTRRPDELAAAIEACRGAARTDGTPVG